MLEDLSEDHELGPCDSALISFIYSEIILLEAVCAWDFLSLIGMTLTLQIPSIPTTKLEIRNRIIQTTRPKILVDESWRTPRHPNCCVSCALRGAALDILQRRRIWILQIVAAETHDDVARFRAHRVDMLHRLDDSQRIEDLGPPVWGLRVLWHAAEAMDWD